MPWLWHGVRTSCRGSGMSEVRNDNIPNKVLIAVGQLKNERIDIRTASWYPPPTSRIPTEHGMVEKRYYHIHTSQLQGQPIKWGVQYLVVAQDETMILRHYYVNRWNQMQFTSEVITAY